MQTEVVFGRRGLAPAGYAQQGNFRAARAPNAPRQAYAPAAGHVDVGAVTAADMKAAIGGKGEKFEALWPGVQEECIAGRYSPQGSRSWPGFFFGAGWLLYRKQYLAFFVAILISLALAYVVPGHPRWLNLALSIAISRYGKWWILRNAAMTVARVRSLGLSESETRARIERQCRPSWWGPIVGGLLMVALVCVALTPAFMKGFHEGYERAHAAHANQP
jgi:hypothetical protein